jgi:2-iminobutanoate/2-iminopropanoate deaminase
VKTALAAAGTTPSHIVKLNYYVVGLDGEKLKALREVRGHYLDEQHLPASTLAGVQALFRPDVMVEIEVTATLP